MNNPHLFFMRGALASVPARFSIIPQPSSFVNRQIVQKFRAKISRNWAKIFFVQFAQKFFSANCIKNFFSKLHKNLG